MKTNFDLKNITPPNVPKNYHTWGGYYSTPRKGCASVIVIFIVCTATLCLLL